MTKIRRDITGELPTIIRWGLAAAFYELPKKEAKRIGLAEADIERNK